MNRLYGKILISGKLTLLTGLHIGGGNDFAAIGAVDSVVVRNPVTMEPYIPGSSVKGKMRYLLARVLTKSKVLNSNLNDEPAEILRLFGSSKKNGITIARLQFKDLFFDPDSVKRLKQLNTDLYLTEIKYENSINRGTAEANPRQKERVLPDSRFDFSLVYNIESEEELSEDMANVARGLKLLEEDYLGANGTRGYGRIKFESMRTELEMYSDDIPADKITDIINSADQPGKRYVHIQA